MIDIGPGVFVGNVAADLPEDDRLLIRGTRHGPRTILAVWGPERTTSVPRCCSAPAAARR